MVVDQALPDRDRVAADSETELDHLAVRLAPARCRSSRRRCFCRDRLGEHLVDISEPGMDSISIMFLVFEVRENFGLQLEPRDIVYNRTLADLARYVAARSNGSSSGVSVGG